MDMQLRQFTNRTIGRMKLSNCITDDIAICINDYMQIDLLIYVFDDFPYFNIFFINIHENANYVD